MRYNRTLWYRDEHGRQQMVLVGSDDAAELDRVAALYAALEAQSRAAEEAWRARHARFADLPSESGPDDFPAAAGTRGHSAGFPWEGPRFGFAYLLGEGLIWGGPESLWSEGAGGERVCRCCRGVEALPPTACCLNCARTGRDLAIPRPTPLDLKKRKEREAAPTRVPEPKRDRAGRELAGGLGRRRAARALVAAAAVLAASLGGGSRADQAGDFAATANGTDMAAATQAQVDIIQARTARDQGAGGTVTFTARPDSYGFEAPVYVDGAGVEVAGPGAHSTRLRGQNYYGGPILALGVTRLETLGMDPAHYRVQSPVSSQGISTRGEVILMATAHPAQLGAPWVPGGLIPDYWQADSYCYEFVIRLGKGATGASAGLFGVTRPGDGMPAPWSFRYGRSPGRLALWTRNEGQVGDQRCEDEWDYPDDGQWHRIRVQKDDAAAGISAWIDGKAVAVTRSRTDGTTVKPGDRQAKHDGATPFTVGYSGGGPAGYVAVDLAALNVSVGRKFVLGRATETRTDGKPVDDSSFFEIANKAGSLHLTAFLIPFNDAPKTHVALASQTGRGVGFLVARSPHFASNIRIRGLSLSTLIQAPIAIGPLFDLDMRDVWSGRYSLQGVAALPVACSYTVTTDRCRFGGVDAAYVAFDQILHSAETRVIQTGRDGWRLEGTDAVIRDCTYTFAINDCETYCRTVSQGYAGSLVLERHMVDNEAGGPSVAVVDVEQSPYCPNLLVVDGFKVSTNAAPRFVRVTGFRTKGNGNMYPPGRMDVRNLSVFSGYGGPGVEVNGVGWYGVYDPNGMGVSKVAGDAPGLKVMPLMAALDRGAGAV